MIKEIKEEGGETVFKTERDAPVAGHLHTPMLLKLPLERMQAGAGKEHILHIDRSVQTVKQSPQTVGVFGLNPFGTSCKEESLQTFVSKAFNHTYPQP